MVRVSASLLPDLPHPRNLKQVKKAAKVLQSLQVKEDELFLLVFMMVSPTTEVPSTLIPPASLLQKDTEISAWLQPGGSPSLKGRTVWLCCTILPEGSRDCSLKNFLIHMEFEADTHGWERNHCEASSAVPWLDSGLHHGLSGTRSFLFGTFFFASFSSFPPILTFLLF